MFTLRIEYLSGRCVASDLRKPGKPEWPPHPARFFMAAASGWFESKRDPLGEQCLRWLETLELPALSASDYVAREELATYVPVNDKAVGGGGLITTTTPFFPRKRAERKFRVAIPHDPVVWYHWPVANLPAELKPAMDKLLDRVTRIGHASSLVVVTQEEQLPDQPSEHIWIPKESPAAANIQVRCIPKGALDSLTSMWNPAQEWLNQLDEANTAVSEDGLSKVEAKKRKKSLQTHIKSCPAHPRPRLDHWVTYTRLDEIIATQSAHQSLFHPELVVLQQIDGAVWNLENTRALVMALRGTCRKHMPDDAPEWIHGHAADGKPSQRPHIAFLPLAYVGNEHADGHGMGFALAIPKDVDMAEVYTWFGPVFTDEEGQLSDLQLRTADNGKHITLRMQESTRPAYNLRSSTWTHASKTWASATPVVLDRFPRANPRTRPDDWMNEIKTILTESCLKVGLPAPSSIECGGLPYLEGAPHARDVPALTFKQRGASRKRYHTHVKLHFDQPIQGPVLLGQGRYQGYGFCRPISSTKGDA